MATKVVEVRECDRCGKDPALTWVITGPDGGTREIELCDRHAAAVANAFALARPVQPARVTVGRRGRLGRPPVQRSAPPVVAEPEPVWR